MVDFQYSRLATIFLALASFSWSLNPNAYIWLNPLSRPALTPLNSTHLTCWVPCQARLGPCRYQYRLLPPGWSHLVTGAMVIPRSDTLRQGNVYALVVEMSEISGEAIVGDLVVRVAGGVLELLTWAVTLQQSAMDASEPAGYPGLGELQGMLAAGNEDRVIEIMDRIEGEYVPCLTKLNYVLGIRKLLEDRVKANTDTIRQRESQISGLVKQIEAKTQERAAQAKKLGIEQQKQMLESQLAKASHQLAVQMQQQTRLSDMAKQALEKITNPSNYSTNFSGVINEGLRHEAQRDKIDAWLDGALLNRRILARAINELKLRMASGELQGRPALPLQQIVDIRSKYQVESSKLVNNQFRAAINQIRAKQAQEKKHRREVLLGLVGNRVRSGDQMGLCYKNYLEQQQAMYQIVMGEQQTC